MNKTTYEDGKRYLVTFNNGRDQVEATYIAEFNIFNFFCGSISIEEAEKVDEV